MKLDDIKEIIDLMTENELSEFEMEEDGVRISIKKGTGAPVIQTAPVVPLDQQNTVAVSELEEKKAVENTRIEEIKAPFVGTFYRASSPDAEPYVTVGQEVEVDSVLCVIEAMKVMNEIKTDTGGVIKEILVENAHPVQFGDTLFKIEKV